MTCECGHAEPEHGQTARLCMVNGCSCQRFRRHKAMSAGESADLLRALAADLSGGLQCDTSGLDLLPVITGRSRTRGGCPARSCYPRGAVSA